MRQIPDDIVNDLAYLFKILGILAIFDKGKVHFDSISKVVVNEFTAILL